MRYYSSVATPGALQAGIDASATSITVSGATGRPAQFPFTEILDPDTEFEEIVNVLAINGSSWTVQRGQDGTSAVSHGPGAITRHEATARDLREPQQHIAATQGVHGVSGPLVGTSGAQTLTGKTIDGTDNTITNLNASNLSSGTVPSARLADRGADVPFVPALGGNWTGSIEVIKTYRWVDLYGTANRATATTGDSEVFNDLPTIYRPAQTRNGVCEQNVGADFLRTLRCQITSDGRLIVLGSWSSDGVGISTTQVRFWLSWPVL